MEVIITRSKKKYKKNGAVIDSKKTISCGAKGASDMTQHKDPERKQRYIKSHKKNENWNDPKTAGFYAKHVLWNKPTLKASIADLNKQYPSVKAKLKL